MSTKVRWSMIFDTEDMLMRGDGNKTDNKFQGFLSQINADSNGL